MKLGQRKFEQLALKLQTEEVTELRLPKSRLGFSSSPPYHTASGQGMVKD